MSSLYSQYILERQGRETLEDDKGFATFDINGEYCYIVDIFVIKSERRTHSATAYADRVVEMAKERGCKFLLGTVDPRAFGAEISTKVILSYGYKYREFKDNLIWFIKEI